MPEIPLKESPAMARAKRVLPYRDDFMGNIDADGSPFGDSEVQSVINEAGIIANGIEVMVFPHPSNPNRIEAISYGDIDPDRAKMIYYTHKVLHTLFPYNFPRVHASFGSASEVKERKPKFNSGTVRQKVFPDSAKITTHSLKKAFKDLKNMGFIPLVEVFRGSAHNTIKSGGNEYFIEMIKLIIQDFNPEKVESFIQENNYSELDRAEIRRALGKMMNLRDKLGPDQLSRHEATSALALGLVSADDPIRAKLIEIVFATH